MVERLLPITALPPRGQFEASADFNARIVAEAAKAGITIAPNVLHRVNLSAGRFGLRYDADREIVSLGRSYSSRERNISLQYDQALDGVTAHFDTSFGNPLRLPNRQGSPFSTHSFLTDRVLLATPRTERRQTAFGGDVVARVIEGDGFGLAMPSGATVPVRQSEFRLPRSVAAEEFPTMQAVLEGPILIPVLLRGTAWREATVSYPEEIRFRYWVLMLLSRSITFYSRWSGAVFHRASIS